MSESEAAVNSCTLASPKRCKEHGRDAQATVVTGKFFHEPKIAQLHDEPALICREEAIDFRLANRLLKGVLRA